MIKIKNYVSYIYSQQAGPLFYLLLFLIKMRKSLALRAPWDWQKPQARREIKWATLLLVHMLSIWVSPSIILENTSNCNHNKMDATWQSQTQSKSVTSYCSSFPT